VYSQTDHFRYFSFDLWHTLVTIWCWFLYKQSTRIIQIITYKSKWLRAVCMNHSFTHNTSTSLPYRKIILVLLTSCLLWVIAGHLVLYTYIYIYRHTLSFLLKTRVWLWLDAFIQIAWRQVHTFSYSLSICKKWLSNCSFLLSDWLHESARAGKCMCLILSNS